MDLCIHMDVQVMTSTYTINFKKQNVFPYITSTTVGNEGMTGIGFVVGKHDYSNVCMFDVGDERGDFHMLIGVTTGFYGGINEQGIIVTLGYHGCVPPANE